MYKPIKNFENYHISNTGKVLNTDTNRFRKTFESNGYEKVNLVKNYKETRFYIHRLVAEAFIPNPENKIQVNHINGNKFDNNAENLMWVTPKENMSHAITTLPKIKKPKTHLTKLEKQEIIKMYNKGTNRKTLAKLYNRSIRTIAFILAKNKE